VTIPLITAPAAPRTPFFTPLAWLDVEDGEEDGVLVERLVTVICEAGEVMGEDTVAVNDVTIVCCMVDADVDDPGKVRPGRVTPFAAHSWTSAAGK
jgi:hypothetical protein